MSNHHLVQFNRPLPRLPPRRLHFSFSYVHYRKYPHNLPFNASIQIYLVVARPELITWDHSLGFL